MEFVGLPRRCFFYRQMGHLAKNCPRRNVKLGEKNVVVSIVNKRGMR